MKLFKLREDYSPHPFKWWHIPLLILLIGGTVYIALTSCTNPASTYRQNEGAVFGTFYHVTYCSNNDLKSNIEGALDEVDQSLSPFNPNSVITAINNNTSTETDSMFRAVFTLAEKVSQATDGAFDITCAPLVNAWGFGFKNAENVDSAMIDSLLQFVGYKQVALQGTQIIKQDPRTMLDCSAIAKGYGVDAVALCLEKEGVTDYMVEIGGEVRVKGVNPKGEPWRIGVNKPQPDSLSVNGPELQEVLTVTDISLATSGNYRNFYIKNNKRYAHTIDPRKGFPVEHSLLSATVFAKDCATADAYATAFMVMGLDKAKQLLSKQKDIKAYFIYSTPEGENAVWYSDGLIDN